MVVSVIIFIVKKARKQRTQPTSGTEGETNVPGHYGGVFPKAEMFWQNRGESMGARMVDHRDARDTGPTNAISKAMTRFSNIVSTKFINYDNKHTWLERFRQTI